LTWTTGNVFFFSEETSRALRVFVAASDLMALARQKVSEEGARSAGTQNENAHQSATLPHSLCRSAFDRDWRVLQSKSQTRKAKASGRANPATT
jgi:hypothetical protein